ncbi:MAG TPA: RNA polymerase sigma factor [Fimbriiglobus sp.]|jgi:RNA polymerase sigma-70 factor (ECF subfamily)
MAKRADSPPATAQAAPSPDEALLVAFDGARDDLISTLMYVLRDRDDAQDAAQEAFLKCWKARAQVPDVLNLRAWIFRVGLNTAKDMRRSAWHRKSRPLVGEDFMPADDGLEPGGSLDDRDRIARLRRAIADLRPDEQEVFLLRQNGDLTYEQIAELRKAPVGTVKTQMRSALIKLKKVLNPDGGDSETGSDV